MVPDWLADVLLPKKAPVPWADMVRAVFAIWVPLAAEPGRGTHRRPGLLLNGMICWPATRCQGFPPGPPLPPGDDHRGDQDDEAGTTVHGEHPCQAGAAPGVTIGSGIVVTDDEEFGDAADDQEESDQAADCPDSDNVTGGVPTRVFHR